MYPNPHRFATDVEQILSAMANRPLIAFDAPLESLRTRLPEATVVCDANTHAALGARAAQTLGAECVVLPGTPQPDSDTVAWLREHTADAKGLLAVGSGIADRFSV